VAQVQGRPRRTRAPQEDHEDAGAQGEEALKRVTFCLACGATAAAGDTRCPQCDAPLKRKGPLSNLQLPPIRAPSPLTLLVALAVLSVLVAAVTFAVTR
jgi:hypothetical protein